MSFPSRAITMMAFSGGQRQVHQRSYKFSDINCGVASREDKEAMFLEILRSYSIALDSGATTKITIIQPPF